MPHDSAVSRIRRRLAAVIDCLSGLISEIPVQPAKQYEGVIVIEPHYHWGDLTARQRATQLGLKRDYEPISELLRLLLCCAPKDLIRQLDDADKQFRIWLELQGNWSLRSNAEENDQALRSDAAALEQVLDVLEVTGVGGVILVPDTNSLLANSDPVAYRPIAEAPEFVFMLIPTVLGELDFLKVEHRNPEVRDKAKSVITRIKGWRQQGSLLGGVTVDRSITVKVSHSEPDMKNTLSWLDPDVKDDRIVASVIALQAEVPSARTVLVTGDINLQNKADAALIETVETP